VLVEAVHEIEESHHLHGTTEAVSVEAHKPSPGGRGHSE